MRINGAFSDSYIPSSPGYPEDTIYAETTRDLKRALAPGKEEFLAELQLTPREAALHASSLDRGGVGSHSLAPLIVAEYIGVPLQEAYLSFNSCRMAEKATSTIGQRIKNAHQYRRTIEVDVDQPEHMPAIEPFECVLREVSSDFLPLQFGVVGSRSLLLQLPTDDFEELLRNSKEAPCKTGNAFAFVRFRHLEDHRVELLEFRSDFHSYLKSPELQQKYRHWPHILMRGLIDCVAHSIPQHKKLAKVQEDDATRKRSVQIVIPAVKHLLEIYKEDPETFQHFGTISYENEDDPSKAKYRMPGLSEAEARKLYVRLPADYGFRPAPEGEFSDLKVGELDDEKYSRPLTLTVDFVRSKADTDPMFKPFKLSKRIDHWLSMSRRYFTHVAYTVIDDQPYPLSRPAKPETPNHLREASLAIQEGAEVCQALRYREETMPCSTPEFREAVESLRQRAPGLEIFKQLVPDGFALISKGNAGGAISQWWDLPESAGESVQAQFIHLKDQNRHPSVRLISYDPDGTPQLIGSYSIKGGGVATAEGVRIHQPGGHRLPIYHRLDDIVEKNGEKKLVKQWGGHDLWGGQGQTSSIGEFSIAGELATFCAAVDPRIADGIAVPIASDRLLSIPTWKDDGTTAWHDPIQYQDSFMPKYGGRNGFFQTLTYSKSDVRLSQLVSKIFNGIEEGFSSITALEEEIKDSLRLLFLTHGKEFNPGDAELLPDATLGVREIARFVSELGKENAEAGAEIYREFELRSLACLAAIHGTDGHLGGVKKGAGGLMFGGPQSIRNIDLYGTMHDYDTHPFLPWSSLTACDGVRRMQQFDMLTFYQAADTLLLKESLYWLKMSLTGLETTENLDMKRVPIDSRQDITVLTSNDSESRHLASAVAKMNKGAGPEAMLGDERQIEMYRQYANLGKDLASQLTEDPRRIASFFV